MTNRILLRRKIKNNIFIYYVARKLFSVFCLLTHVFHIKPDFLIIGAAKCGTSSLYDYLMEHPCVGKSLTKQIHFFDRYFDRKISWYKVCFPSIFEKFYFVTIKKQRFVTGEATAHYMTHPLASRRAFSVVPNAKIIVMLRNPVTRAYSHYQMEKANGNEELSFQEAIDKEPERITGEIEDMFNNRNNSGKNYPHRAYIKSGLYLEQIKRWTELYPKENFLFIKSEQFNENPSEIYHKVLKFLDLPKYDLKKYEKIRKRNYEKLDSSTRDKLMKYYYPFNIELFKYLKYDFDWS